MALGRHLNCMEHVAYTHALWRVRPGCEADFVEAWTVLAEVFSSLARPPLWGTLLRSATEPCLFYSFGPWRSADDVAQMRSIKAVQVAMSELQQLCDESTPGLYHVVKHVKVTST